MQIPSKHGEDFYSEEDVKYSYRCVLRDNTPIFPTVDLGGKVKIMKHDGNLLLIRVSGGYSWCGRGDTSYSHPEYLLGIHENETFFVKYCIKYCRNTAKKAKMRALEILKYVEH